MAEKKTTKEVKPADKKIGDILTRHPAVQNTARGLFRNENGTTIVQERVPRGDLPQDEVIMPRNEWDLTSDDLRSIADAALKNVDPILEKYDRDVALEDALAKTVWSKDGCKYQGRLSALTQRLILDEMKSGSRKRTKKASEEGVIESNNGTTCKEAGMDREQLMKEASALAKKLDALKVLLDDDSTDTSDTGSSQDKNASWDKDPLRHSEEFSRGLKKTPSSLKNVPQTEEASDKSVVDELDEIANMVEKEAVEKKDYDLFRIAFEIDRVSDCLSGSKEAATLEQDSDEDYMRKAFKSAINEHDADESYMKEFSNDNTKETSRVVGQVSVQHKQASELPYAVKKDA